MGRVSKRLKMRAAALVFIVTAGILLSLAGITAARYMNRESGSGIVEAQVFYFSSDYLKEDADQAVYFIDPTADTFTVELYNFEDSKRVTTEAVTYSVSVSGGTVSSHNEDGVIQPGQSNTAVLVISPSVTQGGGASSALDDITVNAVSKSPYRKELTGVFKRQLGNRYTVEDERSHIAAVLTMICADGEKDIKIALPSGVIPDASDERVTNYEDNECTFHSPGFGVYSLVLLKSDPDTELTGGASFADRIDISR